MSEIAELRSRIDSLDTDLVRLLNERAEVAKEIGAFKHREGLPIYSPEREDHVLRKLVEKSPGPLTPDSLKAIYREIMSASLALEKDISIACLGPSGSTTHQASRDKFGSSVKYLILPDVESVFKEVEIGGADCGVVPIDEAEHGIMSATLDGLAESSLSICAQIVLASETGGETRSPARLFVLGKSANPPSGHDSTMLMLRIEDKPGALVQALEPFKELEINLNHFASRPASRGSKDIFFFVEAEGHSRELQISDVFRALSMKCRAVKMLGSYPKQSLQD
ncbi:MAG: chorismate mutase [Terrimicrobiaceae bacterium]